MKNIEFIRCWPELVPLAPYVPIISLPDKKIDFVGLSTYPQSYPEHLPEGFRPYISYPGASLIAWYEYGRRRNLRVDFRHPRHLTRFSEAEYATYRQAIDRGRVPSWKNKNDRENQPLSPLAPSYLAFYRAIPFGKTQTWSQNEKNDLL